MIQITPQMRILLSVKAVDFRKGIDGLAGICRQILEADPFSGCVFVFRNSRGTAIKALTYGELCRTTIFPGSLTDDLIWPDSMEEAI